MGSVRPKSPLRASSRSFCIACGSTEPSSTGRRRRLPRNEQTRSQGSRRTAGKDVPAGTMAVVRSPDFLRALNQRDCACNIDPPASFTPSCGGQAPTAERTVGPARMIAESLTPKLGIREHNWHLCDIARSRMDVRFRGPTRTLSRDRRMTECDPKPKWGKDFRGARTLFAPLCEARRACVRR